MISLGVKLPLSMPDGVIQMSPLLVFDGKIATAEGGHAVVINSIHDGDQLVAGV